MKKVLLMVVDALASRVVQPALGRGDLPHMRELIERGQYAPESISIFPSITPAATASIVTGCYPLDHGIPGAFWYDGDADSVAYYGDDIWVVLREGISSFFQDFLVRLNGERLHAPTAFEIVEEAGMQAGCLNYLWFRGKTEHEARVPWLLRMVPGIPAKQPVMGPSVLFLGDFLAPSPYSSPKSRKDKAGSAGVMRRYGFDDQATSAELLGMASTGVLPDFTLAYFPDNDFESHNVGPQQSLHVVKSFDETLRELFEVCGGIDECLRQFAIVITGDHSQSDMSDSNDAGIHLDKILEDIPQAAPGHGWQEGDELMICPNMRAAQIYVRKNSNLDRRRLIESLLAEHRIDQVISNCEPRAQGRVFQVETADRGRLRFWRADDVHGGARDAFGNSWQWEGDLGAVDASVNDAGEITYGDYPNALERVSTAFCGESSQLWLTARIGHEFCVAETSIHEGGSHGSLHALDSVSPLIASGLPPGFELALPSRSVDVLSICLHALGLPLSQLGAQERESQAIAHQE